MNCVIAKPIDLETAIDGSTALYGKLLHGAVELREEPEGRLGPRGDKA